MVPPGTLRNVSPKITPFGCLLAQILARCAYDLDYSDELELARRIACVGATVQIRTQILYEGLEESFRTWAFDSIGVSEAGERVPRNSYRVKVFLDLPLHFLYVRSSAYQGTIRIKSHPHQTS
jgi:hypothetical protein